MSAHQTITTIEVESASLHYPLQGGTGGSLRGALADMIYLRKAPARTRPVAALDGISFVAHDGDRIALIGANGAGKTTLLRTLAGIYVPDSGRVKILGRILPFFGHFPGVNPDATGAENVKLAAYSMGVSPRSVPDLVADVEAFTELGRFMAMPLRVYSTGMSAKLLFAIATALTADVFVLDEFSFATGDRFFKERAQQRSIALMKRAKTVVLASHDEEVVRNICEKAILLHQGKMIAFGPTHDVLKEYAKVGSDPGPGSA